MREITLLVCLLPLLAACGGVQVREVPQLNLDPSVASYALEDGAAEVFGSGFARQRGGDVVSCAGNEVWLLPDTPFFRWVVTPVSTRETDPTFSLTGGASRTTTEWPIAARLEEAMAYVKRTQCDIDGRFSFREVPNGRYFVATVITWMVQSLQGGVATEPVAVVDQDATVEVTVQR